MRSPLVLVSVLARNSGRIALAALVAAVLAGAAWALLPKRYTARVALYVPQAQIDPRLQGMMTQLPGALLGMGGLDAGDRKMVDAILHSRTLRDSLDVRFGRHRKVNLRTTPEGAIAVDVTHRDPAWAQQIAAAYPELVNEMVISLGLVTHQRRQEFLRRQVTEAHDELTAIEEQLVEFQTVSNAPELEEQARQTIDAAAQLQRRVVEKEIEVGQLRRLLTPDHPELRAAEAELAAWRQQLARLGAGTGGRDIFVPLDGSPQLRAGAYRLARELRAREQVYISLRAALEQAELDARRDLPVVSVIDAPVVPDRPSSPGLVAVLVLGTIAGLLVGTAWALLAHWWRAPGNTQATTSIRSLRQDLAQGLRVTR
jgi:LPS O-antigen subunit length determinant protein (WzzB/FepE family)